MRLLSLSLIAILFACTSASGQCPSISIIGPQGVTSAGDEMKFQVELNPATAALQYSWAINAGSIREGQGTPIIVVATDKGMADRTVIATIQIKGLASGCATTASETAPILAEITDWFPDEWGMLKPNEIRGRLDNFFIELSNNPSNTGLVVLSIKPNERFDVKNRRLRFVLKHAEYRNFPRNRLWFGLSKANEQRTSVWRMPPGGDMPPCDNCLIIKGGDLR